MVKSKIVSLISNENELIIKANSNCEKLDRVNNILQLKIHSSIPELESDIYINVKNFILYYTYAIEEKQYYYDEFDEEKIFNYLNLFGVDQKCSLLQFTIRHLKIIGLDKKIKIFENEFNKCEFLKEWSKLNHRNFFKVLYLATVYNHITIFFSLLFCFIAKVVIYLPAPDGWPILFELHYVDVSNVQILNHIGNVLLSIFNVQENPSFVTPTSLTGAIVFVLGKCFFILIVINILIDQLIKRFKM